MIEINNLTKSPVDKKFLEKIAKKVLQGESFFAKASKDKGKKLNKDLSIALVGFERMRELNKKYRGKNLATDVLSFQYGDSDEVVICFPQVKKNAKKFKFTFKKELARVLIHGILHLLGFNHEENEREASKMRKKEANYLFSEMN